MVPAATAPGAIACARASSSTPERWPTAVPVPVPGAGAGAGRAEAGRAPIVSAAPAR
ncbi:hypothetical protein [Streptomyces sp. NPDC005533]|uniref:hypothetical protein n=1 Tax=Streptomyces sp. NPDC005533 TaxID=3364723 RepID=UPI0036BF9C83